MIGMDANTGKPLAGADHLAQSIGKILGTPIGTRVGRRDFGSHLPELLDQPLNAATRVRLIAAGALALLRQEPRIRASRITLAPGNVAGGATLMIEGTRVDGPRPVPLTLSTSVRAFGAR